jgi:ubiquinone/menaquinone biosynthesis C-methylase UbiE
MDVREASLKFYVRAQKWIIPDLKYSQTIYEEVLWKVAEKAGRWLDLGCGHQLLPPWRLDSERELSKKADLLLGLDYDYESLANHRTIKNRVRGDIFCLPFHRDAFNLVTSNMVFEHLKEPEAQLKEIYRVLKPGGVLVFHTPNSLNYAVIMARLAPDFILKKIVWLFQKRKEEDIFPTFYRINRPGKIVKVASEIGFEVVSMRLIVSHAQFRILPPLAVLELLFIRLLMTRLGKPFRGNIITVLKKPESMQTGRP